MTSGGLWNYYGYEIDDADCESVGKSFGSDGKSFGYKTNCRKNTKKTSTTRSSTQENPQAQRPMPASHVKPLFYSNILVIFEDFLIYH